MVANLVIAINDDRMEAAASADNDDILVYMGWDTIVPRDVIRCRVHPSVTVIPEETFYARRELEEVELSEGLLEIGVRAFYDCISLKRINKIPSTVIRIDERAFCLASLRDVHLPDGIVSIGSHAFFYCNMTALRIPPLITTIPTSLLESCTCMSLELSENIREIQWEAFGNCYSLRNVAIPPNAVVVERSFLGCTDLKHIFGTSAQIINALKHRFDGLPIHKMIYYQSYNNLTSDQLNNAADLKCEQLRALRSILDPTGKQQDCLGMTPLHILACSTVQDIQIYRLLVDKYPENLIAEDEWGAPPLLYAVWGNAPNEIVQYLVERYQSLYSNYEFDWTMMVITLAKVSKSAWNMLLSFVDLQKKSFPNQCIDWDVVLENLSPNLDSVTFQQMVKLCITKRVNAIGIKSWRVDMIAKVTEGLPPLFNKGTWLNDVKSKLSRYEVEYLKLKEATSMLELALWKNKINETNSTKGGARKCKKVKVDDTAVRNQCRVNCGANIIIENVLPYLVR